MRLAALAGLACFLLTPIAQAKELAHPALWRVQGPLGTVFLFGSVHVLPKDLDWQTPQIAAAMKQAQVFVFEVPSDAKARAEAQAFVAAHGLLPPGASLRAELPAASQILYERALAKSGLPRATIDARRPWLADLMLTIAAIKKEGYRPDSGADAVIAAKAQGAHKDVRYLETIGQQLSFIAPEDDALALQELEADLKSMAEGEGLGTLVKAWSKGDVAGIDDAMNAELAAFPEAKKTLLDDRNKAWVKRIQTMLEEKRTFFITAGAGHLAGPGGVPDLLKAAGYKVGRVE